MAGKLPDDMALKALKRIGYLVKSRDPLPSCERSFYYTMQTPDGIKKIRLVTRRHIQQGRYPIGINPRAFGYVDLFAFWMQGEKVLFIVPEQWLKSIYDSLPSPSINDSGQWFCNIEVHARTFETAGVERKLSLEEFTIRKNAYRS